MPKRKEPAKPNLFQHCLRGIDASKTTAVAYNVSKHANSASREHFANVGFVQLTAAAFTTLALITRIYEEPARLKSNFLGIALRSGIILLDALSGIFILSDLEEKKFLSSMGKSLVGCSMFMSHIIGQDGHHDEEIEEKFEDVEKDTEKTSLIAKTYGSR